MERIELSSPAWKAGVISHYTTSAYLARIGFEPITTLPYRVSLTVTQPWGGVSNQWTPNYLRTGRDSNPRPPP